MRMSDLGRLFRRRTVSTQEPLENFTTEALAIAIDHDDRPMKQALSATDWSYCDADGRVCVSTPRFSPGDVVGISAKTQLPLSGADLPAGYLDLVLTLRAGSQAEWKLWVAVKVDAWESGSQLSNYERHAARQPARPGIVTLGRLRVSKRVPALRWSDVFNAIAAVPDCHHAWLSLRDFLVEMGIVRNPLPPEVDVDRSIEILVAVNRRIADLWPKAGASLAWKDGALRKSLKTSGHERDLVTTGGPLQYGLDAPNDAAQWCLIVRMRNYQRVLLDAQQILQDADAGGLSQDWQRNNHDNALERRAPWTSLSSHDEVVAWFDEGLRQLRDAGILERYFKGLAEKQSLSSD